MQKNMCDEDSSFKNKNKKQKSHNFNQTPKRFFSTYVSMVLFVCKKMRFVCFLHLDVGMCRLCL
jgi:aminopeptidase C